MRQPNPTHNNLPDMWQTVIELMQMRRTEGILQYHTPLQPFNGRSALNDLRDELLDAVVYTTQLMHELNMTQNRAIYELVCNIINSDNLDVGYGDYVCPVCDKPIMQDDDCAQLMDLEDDCGYRSNEAEDYKMKFCTTPHEEREVWDKLVEVSKERDAYKMSIRAQVEKIAAQGT